jgi:hypothetical protein
MREPGNHTLGYEQSTLNVAYLTEQLEKFYQSERYTNTIHQTLVLIFTARILMRLQDHLYVIKILLSVFATRRHTQY